MFLSRFDFLEIGPTVVKTTSKAANSLDYYKLSQNVRGRRLMFGVFLQGFYFFIFFPGLDVELMNVFLLFSDLYRMASALA